MKRNNYGDITSLAHATLILLNLDAFSYAGRRHTTVKHGRHVLGGSVYLLYRGLQWVDCNLTEFLFFFSKYTFYSSLEQKNKRIG
jgi:hypothetical protein